VFDFDCSSCGKRLLIPPTRVRGLVNDDAGIVIVFDCWCGAASATRAGVKPARPARGPSMLTLAS
jgi:hypothetical protein